LFDARRGLINCGIKVDQDGQRCQYQFAPPLPADLTNSRAKRPALFADNSQLDDFA
jgi:hypothetical protein